MHGQLDGTFFSVIKGTTSNQTDSQGQYPSDTESRKAQKAAEQLNKAAKKQNKKKEIMKIRLNKLNSQLYGQTNDIVPWADNQNENIGSEEDEQKTLAKAASQHCIWNLAETPSEATPKAPAYAISN